MERVFRSVATLCSGIFFGATLYVSLVQHPAALETGTEFAARFFPEMYGRAAVMQASLASVGALAAFAAWFYGARPIVLAAVALLIGVIVFTLVVIRPVNEELISGAIDPSSARAAELLVRWGWLHWGRTILSGLAFAACLVAAPRFSHLPDGN
jgi:hypothetical protein